MGHPQRSFLKKIMEISETQTDFPWSKPLHSGVIGSRSVSAIWYEEVTWLSIKLSDSFIYFHINLFFCFSFGLSIPFFEKWSGIGEVVLVQLLGYRGQDSSLWKSWRQLLSSSMTAIWSDMEVSALYTKVYSVMELSWPLKSVWEPPEWNSLLR